MATFGIRCDAVNKNGKRCQCKNKWEIPCVAVYDARCTSYRAQEFKPVRLCVQHHWKECRLREQGKRIKLHHGGWLGAFNQHKYGNIVLDRPVVDWTKPKLRVPKYWAIATENP